MKIKSATGRSYSCGKSTVYPVIVKHTIIDKATVDTIKPSDFYHFNKNRVASEWEPSKSVIFMCPPLIPKELIIEFAGYTHLYPAAESEEEPDRALEWFLNWGVDTSRDHFIKLQDSLVVPGDWGPPAVFSIESNLVFIYEAVYSKIKN